MITHVLCSASVDMDLPGLNVAVKQRPSHCSEMNSQLLSQITLVSAVGTQRHPIVLGELLMLMGHADNEQR